jgi:hypothetical protein
MNSRSSTVQDQVFIIFDCPPARDDSLTLNVVSLVLRRERTYLSAEGKHPNRAGSVRSCEKIHFGAVLHRIS